MKQLLKTAHYFVLQPSESNLFLSMSATDIMCEPIVSRTRGALQVAVPSPRRRVNERPVPPCLSVNSPGTSRVLVSLPVTRPHLCG